jgi:hypothetical protein
VGNELEIDARPIAEREENFTPDPDRSLLPKQLIAGLCTTASKFMQEIFGLAARFRWPTRFSRPHETIPMRPPLGQR